MIPTVDRHLAAIRDRLAETIFPLLPADAEFAREQAAFVLTALDLVRATHRHEYRYEVVERHDYLAAVASLLELSGPDAAAEAALAAPAPGADEARLPVTDLAEGTRELKAVVARLLAELSGRGGDTAERARGIVHDLAARQVARERALFATTGYTRSAASLGEVLGERPA